MEGEKETKMALEPFLVSFWVLNECILDRLEKVPVPKDFLNKCL